MELLIVIGIIGILSSIVLVSYKDYSKKAKLSNTMQWAKSVHSELGAYAVGGWSFDNIVGNIVYDESGNGNNGTIYGGATQVDGVIGKALSFDGADDYVSIAGSATNHTISTISAWVKPSSVSLSNNRRYFIYDDPTGLSSSYDMGGPSIQMYNGLVRISGGFSGTSYNYVLSNSALTANQWYHIVSTFNSSTGLVQLYVNGVYQNNNSSAYCHTTTINNSTIGNRPGKPLYPWDGLIDDVRIYKEALTQAQIQQHYAEGLKTHQNLAQIERFRNTPD